MMAKQHLNTIFRNFDQSSLILRRNSPISVNLMLIAMRPSYPLYSTIQPPRATDYNICKSSKYSINSQISQPIYKARTNPARNNFPE